MTQSKNKDERLWGMLCHLSALLAYVASLMGIPVLISLTHLIGPIVIWALKRKEHSFVDQQGKEAINFQLSATLYGVIVWLLCFVSIGIPLAFILAVVWLILVIVASIKVSNGESYQYPLTIRFLQ